VVGSASAVGTPPLLLVASGSVVDWGVSKSRVCPFTGLDKQKVAEAASIAAKKGDKRMSLSSFDTSTHHIYCKSTKHASESCFAMCFLFFVHCPLSVKSFNDLLIANLKKAMRIGHDRG
jgi:hypothetical protein